MPSDVHDRLVQAAVRWAQHEMGTGTVCISEWGGRFGEHPDVFAFNVDSGDTLLVEAKVSVHDYLADADKPWRHYAHWLAERQFYIVPHDMPESLVPTQETGWGWLVLGPDNCIHCPVQSAGRKPSSRRIVQLLGRAYRQVYHDASKAAAPGRAFARTSIDAGPSRKQAWLEECLWRTREDPGISVKDVVMSTAHPYDSNKVARRVLAAAVKADELPIEARGEGGLIRLYAR